MHTTRNSWLSAAHGADWFRLTRHDDPDSSEPPEPAEPADPPEPKEPEDDADGTDKLGDAGKKALDRMKAERAAAKKSAAEATKRADELAAKVAEFEDRDKSELERATAKAEAEAQRAEAATKRAVRAEVKAAASAFADPDDAIAFLDLTEYTDGSGEIDTDAITTALEDLLERKPHLRKQTVKQDPEPDLKKGPKPDPSQGPRKDPPPPDWRTAGKDDFKKHLAEKYGARLP